MNYTQGIYVNLVPGGPVPIAHASKGDLGGREISCYIADGQNSAYIGNAVTATVDGIKPDGERFSAPCSLSAGSPASGLRPVASFAVSYAMTNIPGRVLCQITLHEGDQVVGTGNFVLLVEDSPLSLGE